MNISKQIKFGIIFLVFLGTFVSCVKDLDVPNTNDPDRAIIFNSPELVLGVAESSYNTWWVTTNSINSPRMAMWVMADQGTCSWANSGMYHLSSEPRVAFDNDPSYSYSEINEIFWVGLYKSLFMANGVLNAVHQDSMKIIVSGNDKTKQTEGFAYFVKGLSLGYLGLVYDQGAPYNDIVFPYTDLTLYPYQTMIDSAIQTMEKVISICADNSFTIPEHWMNGRSYSNVELSQLANSYAARFMMLGSRNKEQNEAVDWAKVLLFAEDGITEDVNLLMDDKNWKSGWRRNTLRPGWARIDARIIHLMDDSYPWRFPDDGVNPTAAESDDQRLELDFNRVTSHNMKPERGYYHYSNYEYARLSYAYEDVWTSYVPEFLKAENDLIKAEAMARLGDVDGALEIINNGSRTDTLRGNLPDATASNLEEFLEILFYERDIELIQTGFGIAFFDMRRRNMLQKGTMLHFPVPGKELMVMEKPIYSYGGEANADGINTSNGGWFPEK